MVDPIAWMTGLNLLGKTAVEIAGASDAAQRNAQLIEFQKVLIQSLTDVTALQIKNSSLVAQNKELEEEIVRLKDWNRECERYRLVEVAPGLFAYAMKPGMEFGEPPHLLCATCFGKQPRPILNVHQRRYTCHSCDSVLIAPP